MEKPKLLSWLESSDDETSDTEELSSSIDSNKKLLIDCISSSNLKLFHMKIENLPYTITRSEEINYFLDVPDNEVTIRMQYKAKKFNGFALVLAKTMHVAIKIATKYGLNFNGRSVLIYFKPNESSN